MEQLGLGLAGVQVEALVDQLGLGLAEGQAWGAATLGVCSGTAVPGAAGFFPTGCGKGRGLLESGFGAVPFAVGIITGGEPTGSEGLLGSPGPAEPDMIGRNRPRVCCLKKVQSSQVVTYFTLIKHEGFL